MRELFVFIIRYGHFILFCLLQVYSFYLIVRYNPSQSDIFYYSSGQLSGLVHKKYSDISSNFVSKSILDSLSLTITKLQEEKEMYRVYQETHASEKKDSLFKQKYTLLPALIVYNSISTWDNYLLIDKGSNAGVEKGMGVISSKGIIGIVIQVSPDFSKVLSILNSKSSISACLSKTGQFGTLKWNGKNPNIMTLIDLPNHATIQKGDSIVSTQYSLIFPEGIPIGRVLDYSTEGGSTFFTANIQTFEDLSALRHVMVVKNLLKSEEESLLKSEEE